MAAKDFREGTPSAFISAGHSGAIFASALLKMGRLKRIERPAIAVRLPVLNSGNTGGSADRFKRGPLLLDVGANVDCKPEHLRDFGVMGAIYALSKRPRSKFRALRFFQTAKKKIREQKPLDKLMKCSKKYPSSTSPDTSKEKKFSAVMSMSLSPMDSSEMSYLKLPKGLRFR